jgi:hypothetical protein
MKAHSGAMELVTLIALIFMDAFISNILTNAV